MKTIRIAFSGATSTGKTTVINDVSAKASGLTHVPSPARKALADGFKINENGNDGTQYNIFSQHITNFYTHENGIFLFDRCVLDSMSFTRFSLAENKVSKDCAICCGEITNSLIGKYDAIFVCRPFGEIIADGIRNTDLDFQEKIDKLMTETASLYKTAIISLEGSREERMNKVIAVLEKLKDKYEYPTT